MFGEAKCLSPPKPCTWLLFVLCLPICQPGKRKAKESHKEPRPSPPDIRVFRGKSSGAFAAPCGIFCLCLHCLFHCLCIAPYLIFIFSSKVISLVAGENFCLGRGRIGKIGQDFSLLLFMALFPLFSAQVHSLHDVIHYPRLKNLAHL